MAAAERAPATSTDLPAVQADGRLALPWLDTLLARAQTLAGAHALLLHGPGGSGHFEAALLLAQTLLCDAPVSTPVPRACGQCTSCRLVRTRAHPDLRLVLPYALRSPMGWTDDEDARAGEPEGGAKPSKELRIKQIRSAIDWCQQTSGRGRGKVLVLHPADALNTTSANALLKTLEEPPGRLRILLTSVDPERLLPTVRSRCQRLPLALPPPDAARSWLLAQGLEQPDPLLVLAGGSPLEALAWARDGLSVALLAALPRRVAAGDAAALQGLPVPRVVELLLKLSHDAQVQAAGGAPRFFAAAHMPTGADPAALRTWQHALLRVARHDEHPWSVGLLIESLVTQAAAVWADAVPHRPARTSTSLHSAR